VINLMLLHSHMFYASFTQAGFCSPETRQRFPRQPGMSESEAYNFFLKILTTPMYFLNYLLEINEL